MKGMDCFTNVMLENLGRLSKHQKEELLRKWMNEQMSEDVKAYLTRLVENSGEVT